MAVNKELVQYIQDSLKDGEDEAQIRKDLLAHSWKQSDIDEGFVSLRDPQDTTKSVPAAPTTAIANTSEKYKVVDAAKDAYAAIKVNFKTYAVTVAVNLVLSLLIAAVFAFLSVGYIAATYSFNVYIVMILVAIVVAVSLQIITTSAIAVAVNDGAEGKVTSASSVFRAVLSIWKRLVLSSLLLSAIIAGPIFVAVILSGFLAIISGNSQNPSTINPTSNGLGFVVLIATLVWTLVATLRYFMVPYVALFEQDVPVTKTLSRSRQLTTGIWVFMLKLIGSVIVVFLILSIIFGNGSSQQISGTLAAGGSQNNFLNLLTSLLGVFVSAMIVMLYRNRQAVKK